MTSRKAKRLLWTLVLVVVVITICIGFPYLFNLQINVDGGEEVGSYINADNPSETLIISDGKQFVMSLDELNAEGTYQVTTCCWIDYYVNLLTDNGESIITKYSTDLITLQYNGRTIYFTKQ